jgi:DNA-binding transcriptional LysR family regulator
VRDAVHSGQLDLAIGNFGRVPGLRRTLLFKFSLMLVRPENLPAFRPGSTTWAALEGETLIGLPSTSPLQQLIDKHLTRAKVVLHETMVVNSLDMQIAMVEAGHGIGIIPSFGFAVSRTRRVVMTRLTNPGVTMDFHQIQHQGKKLPPGADDFTAFLQSYIARWAGAAGVL